LSERTKTSDANDITQYNKDLRNLEQAFDNEKKGGLLDTDQLLDKLDIVEEENIDDGFTEEGGIND
jgi:hypothetical protein